MNNINNWSINSDSFYTEDNNSSSQTKPEFDLSTMLGQSLKQVHKWQQSEIKRLNKRYKGYAWPIGMPETLEIQSYSMLFGMQEMFKLLQKHPTWLTKKPWTNNTEENTDK